MSVLPTVSVIISTTDAHGDLRRALNSVCGQTLSPTEILVAGDAADHAAQQIVQDAGGNVRWINAPAGYVGAQRNAALRRSQSDLVALLDSSAVWSPKKLERCVTGLVNVPEDALVYTPAVFIDPNGTRDASPDPEFLPSGWILDKLFEEPWIVDSTVVFRRTVWERHGGFDETLTVTTGQNFYLRAARAHRFAMIPEPLTEVFRAGPLSREEEAHHIRQTAEMMHRFYAEQGGDERLDGWRSRRILGELCEQAARVSWEEHNIPMTLRALIGAMHYRPTWRSRLFLYWVLWRTRKERVGMVLAPG
ncbi:MAG TPA: glycosyltransferase family A protein [Planctomycetaceae bacterium]|nr:glycosyltransferase family A protein [Planctomycetaceae bacterium]